MNELNKKKPFKITLTLLFCFVYIVFSYHMANNVETLKPEVKYSYKYRNLPHTVRVTNKLLD